MRQCLWQLPHRHFRLFNQSYSGNGRGCIAHGYSAHFCSHSLQYNFGFLLSMFSKTEVPPAIPTTIAEPLNTDVSTYKDTDENIFAKDNLADRNSNASSGFRTGPDGRKNRRACHGTAPERGAGKHSARYRFWNWK